MGFYLRKSFRMGPVRLNLSKSGLGFSAGVRGARLGVSSRGRSYVHAGRGGLYYRKMLGTSSQRRSNRPSMGNAEATELYEDTGVTFESSHDVDVTPPLDDRSIIAARTYRRRDVLHRSKRRLLQSLHNWKGMRRLMHLC